MRRIVALLGCWFTFHASAQDSVAVVSAPTEAKEETQATHIFYSTRLINANTVTLIPKGVLEFKVAHNFDDIAGDFGGLKNFFGLDNAQDIKIGFQYGLSKRLNLALNRYKG